MKLFACLLALVFLLTSFTPAFIPGLALGTRNIAYAQGGEEKPAVNNIDLTAKWQQLGLDPNLLEPEFVAMMPDGNSALVTIQEGSAVAAVYNDGGTWRLADIFQLAAEAEPDGIAITGDGKLAVTANEENQTVSLLDLSRGLGAISLTGTVDVLGLLKDEPNLKKSSKGKVDPEGITTFSRNGKRYAVVTLEKSACLLALDITDPQNVQKVTLLPVGVSGDAADPADREAEPEGVAVSPDGSLVAVGNEEEGTVSLIPVKDGQNGIAFGPRVDYDPEGSECEIVSFTPDGKKLLVTNSKEKQVLILNISSLNSISTLKSVSVATYGEPTSVAVHPGGEYALVTVADGQNPTVVPGKVLGVSLRDGALGRIFQDFTVGQVPDSIAISSAGKWAVVANEAENSDETNEDDLITGSIAVLNLTGFTPPGGGAFTGAKIAIFADPHYFDPALLVERGQAFEEYLARDRKLIAESSAIVRAAVDAIKASDANLVLVPGDLTKDGEKSGHQQFASLLAELEAAGKKVYVINGNHDVNNTYAEKYLGETTERVDNVSPTAFTEIYREFGYGEALATDPGSLSYVAEPVPGLRLIAMDDCVYEPEAKCEGAFSTETLNWIKQQVAASREEGKLVIGMMHHGLIDHFSVQRQFFPDYIVQDADRVAAELADGGLQAVFTGHFHAQDIVQKQFGKKTLYDIETGSLVTYPIPYRIAEITPERKLNIATHRIQSINYDLGGQDFTTYARNYLVQGLNGLVPQVVAGILIKQGVSPEQALGQANAKLSTPVAANLTVKDLLVNAMVGHYQGDEAIDPQLMPVIQAMAGSTDSLTKMIGQTLLSLGTDSAPADNEALIDLMAAGSGWNLIIMHTNDTHSHLDDDKALIARRATAVKQIRGEAPNNLLLDAGDVFSGTLYFTQYQGQADLEFMNTLGYAAMALGNHEFDKGPAGLAKFITGDYAGDYQTAAGFPLLNANFDFSAELALRELAKTTVGEEAAGASLGGAIYPAVILDVNGEKVGLLGVTTEDTAEISSPGPNIKINDALGAASSTVKKLSDKGINKIIALSHLGWDQDLELARQVEGIDVVVGGHSHTKPEQYPTVVTDSQHNTPALVVQAGEYGKYLGRLDVDFDKAGLVSGYGGGLLDVAAKDAAGNYTYAVDQAVYERLMSYKAPLEDLKNTMVGRTQVALDGERNNVRTKETNLGNLIADAMLEKGAPAGAVLAITNGGGIRTSVDQGEITLGEILTVMPFGNTLVVLELNGQQIIAALENGVGEVEKKAGKFPQVAGIKFIWDPQKPAGSRIVKVEVKTANGYQPLDRNASYLVATNNFMAGGGDGYTIFKAASRIYDMGFVDYEVFKEYLQKHSPVNPQVEGRITEGEETLPSGDGGGDNGGGSGGGPSPSGASPPVSDSVVNSALEQAAKTGKVTLEAARDKAALALKTEQVNRLTEQARPVEVKIGRVRLVVPAAVLKAAAALAPNVAQIEVQARPVAKDAGESLVKGAKNAARFKLAGDVFELELCAFTKDGKKQNLTAFSAPVKIVLPAPAEKRAPVAKLLIARHNEKEKLWEPLPTVYDEKSGTFTAETNSFSKYALLEEVAVAPPQPPVKTFADIQGHWAQKDIELMAQKEVVHGVAPDRFAPDAPVTRAEFAAMLVNALGVTETGPVPFKDVPAAGWHNQSVAKAYAAGLVKGVSADEFAPQAPVTRQEFAAMLVRALAKWGYPAEVSAGEETQILSRFTDRQEIAPWAANVLAAAVKAGLVAGRTDALVAPAAGATRAESVVLIKRLLQRTGKL